MSTTPQLLCFETSDQETLNPRLASHTTLDLLNTQPLTRSPHSLWPAHHTAFDPLPLPPDRGSATFTTSLPLSDSHVNPCPCPPDRGLNIHHDRLYSTLTTHSSIAHIVADRLTIFSATAITRQYENNCQKRNYIVVLSRKLLRAPSSCQMWTREPLFSCFSSLLLCALNFLIKTYC